MNSTFLRIILISFLLVLLIPNLTLSETKTFIKEYTYQASDEDSKNSSRTISLREVKRLLLEELGTYLESITEVKNSQLTKDQITTLTAGIVQTELVEEKWDGRTYWLKAKITADSSEVIKAIDALRKDHQKIKELEDLRKRSDDLLKENERLRKELTTATGEKKQKDTEAYNRTIKELAAGEWLEKGLAAYKAGNFKDAIDAYDKAIELNPEDAYVYVGRGIAYYELGKYKQAIKDYDKAIELNPKDADAYALRGAAYDKLGNHNQSIQDFNEAIELNPKLATYYYNRGVSYHSLGNDNQAIKDYDKAIEIDAKYADAYTARGMSYGLLGNYRQAIKDLDKVIEIDPKRANVYMAEGLFYEQLGNHNQAIEDIKIAARLGSKKAQDILRSQGIAW